MSTNFSGMYWMPVFVERSGCCLSLRKNVIGIYEVRSSSFRRSIDS